MPPKGHVLPHVTTNTVQTKFKKNSAIQASEYILMYAKCNEYAFLESPKVMLNVLNVHFDFYYNTI